jgi:uncharacterized protein (TIGR00290 family)
LISWSGGKDACMALHRLRSAGEVEVAGLLTTLVSAPERVAVHEVEAELIRLQADLLGLPLVEVQLPQAATNAQYEDALATSLATASVRDVDAIAYGDLFLEDIRKFRTKLAARLGLRAIYPVWGEATRSFARSVIETGVKAIVCSVDVERMPAGLVGREFDDALLADLPADVDPCGENGEFHTFVYDAPGFSKPAVVGVGRPEVRGRMAFCPLSRM